MKRVLILTTLLILTACTAAVESPTPSPSPTATATLTPSATATSFAKPAIPALPTPTLTQTPLPPAIETPIPFIPASIVNDFEGFLYGGPDCSLPCWHGLHVAESTQSDVRSTFAELFELGNGQDIISDHPFESQFYPDFIAEQFYLEVDQPAYLFLDVNLWFSPATTTLEGLSVYFFVDEAEEHKFSMERILETFGEPDHLFVGETGTGSRDSSGIWLLAVYNEGFAFFHGGLIPRSEIDNQFVSEYCLAQRLTHKGLYLFGSLDSEFSEFTQIQGLLLGTEIVDRDLVPSEELLMVDKAEITRRAVEEENPCFEFPSRY